MKHFFPTTIKRCFETTGDAIKEKYCFLQHQITVQQGNIKKREGVATCGAGMTIG
jgi:hypothetical protein